MRAGCGAEFPSDTLREAEADAESAARRSGAGCSADTQPFEAPRLGVTNLTSRINLLPQAWLIRTQKSLVISSNCFCQVFASAATSRRPFSQRSGRVWVARMGPTMRGHELESHKSAAFGCPSLRATFPSKSAACSTFDFPFLVESLPRKAQQTSGAQ